MALVFTAQQAANLWRRGIFPTAKLRPARLENYQYTLPESVLTDRYFGPQYQLLKAGVVTADNTLVIDEGTRAHHFFWTLIGENPCYLAAVDNDYAIGMPSSSIYRFEVHRNDIGPGSDTTNNRRRAELISNESLYTSGQTVWASWAFVIPSAFVSAFDATIPNFVTTRDRCSIWQWHAPSDVLGGPWLTIELNQGKLEICTRSSVTGNSTPVVRYTATRPDAGTVHYVVTKATLGASGQLSVWLDGTQIVNTASGTPIGHYSASSTIGYPQFGIYQANLDDPSAMYICNPEWGTTDLTARIATPLTVTAPVGGWV